MLQRIRDFRLMDDDFMTKCFEENIEATELVLRIVLDKPDIKVEKIQTQYSMKNIKGRSLRLDIYAMDSTGKKYNIEIQRADKGAGAKRARYNSSLIDSDILPAGFEVENLAETKEGIQAMCKIMEDMITDEKKNAAIRMLERGKLTKEEISEDLDLPLSVVDGLADELQQS
ncbi:MAG: hypothetical protein HDT39_06970 [Lachnospiraceae bacterium]|nr:hypothetical protein [Lachnospiraceae bacterium]